MKRLALLMACLAASAAQTCLAEDPAFCKSMCASEQRECRADAQLPPQEQRLAPSQLADRNPFARAAQNEVQGPGTRALGDAGDTNRRVARVNACDTRYQQCTRSCAVPQHVDKEDKAAHQPPSFG